MKGRKPIPPELKILRGDRSNRVNHNAPKPPRGRPDKPRLDKIASAMWDRLVVRLDELGVLTTLDGEALALLCETYSLYRKAKSSVRKEGVLIPAGTGSLKANPACTVLAAAAAQLTRLLTEFGATPSARSRVSTLGTGQPVDPLEEFLGKRKA